MKPDAVWCLAFLDPTGWNASGVWTWTHRDAAVHRLPVDGVLRARVLSRLLEVWP